jgi:hypothetical protein
VCVLGVLDGVGVCCVCRCMYVMRRVRVGLCVVLFCKGIIGYMYDWRVWGGCVVYFGVMWFV